MPKPKELRQAVTAAAEGDQVRVTTFHAEPGELLQLGTAVIPLDEAERLRADLDRIIGRIRCRG